jgi:choline dehydrogenase-like flavoprotein
VEVGDVSGTLWDVIVVGTGVGGSTLGFALARAGQRVLFCEKGSARYTPDAILGAYPELQFPEAVVPGARHRHILARAGRCYDLMEDRSARRPRRFIPYIGCGPGGSSSLYGMAMERFFAADFKHWPVSYSALEPYYETAEALYRVRGELDPLRSASRPSVLQSPPPLSQLGSELFQFFQAKGMHPYRLPLACEFVSGCRACQGYLCDRNCKNDSRRICLAPAVASHGATLLEDCEVFRLEATATDVTGVMCTWRGEELRLRGRLVVLAAGALESPCILLRSSSELWPLGLANSSGLVGRNLMRHHVDLYALAADSMDLAGLPHKEIAFNDFYLADDYKLGTVQSFGLLPPASMLAASLVDDLRSALPWVAPLLERVTPAAATLLKRMLRGRAAIATIVEDPPYDDNLVMPAPAGEASRAVIRYRMRSANRARIRRFRALMGDLLKPYRFTLIKQGENSRMLAHACGTCRFGDDPATSVLDANNRAHELGNLYVVDSSFFPSSGGTNPSLTIAANALRVAAHLGAKPLD